MSLTSNLNRNQWPSRLKRGAALLLSALTLGVGAGCSDTPVPVTPDQEEESATASASFAINLRDFTQPASTGGQGRRLSAQSSRGDVSALAFSAVDVRAIRIDVTDTATSAPIYVNFDLEKDTTGTWVAKLPLLPKNRPLTFTAKASDASNALIFSGTTQQTLSSNFSTVVIVLSPATNNQTVVIPRVLRISVPSAFGSDQAGNVSFSVEARTGERLTYTITPAANGGSFFPLSGAITLATTSGTFVSQYAAPLVSSETTFTHEVKITNEAGHSVSTTFVTRVKPPNTFDRVLDTTLNVLFNPVINALTASRVVGTGNVLWTAGVDDDGSPSELVYAWGFTPDGTFTPTPAFADAATNPGTLRNYTTSVQGTLRVDVTDRGGAGGTTTLFYQLRPNQFPDNPTQEGGNTGINSIRLGDNHTCTLFNNGSLRCWGYNAYGQLGLGNTFTYGDNEQAHVAGPVPLTGTITRLAVGGNHTCALLDSGLIRCWGRNNWGQLGYNSTQHVGDGEQVDTFGYVNLGGLATKIAAGHGHTCALMETGKVRCWGYNGYGQLGYGTTQNIGDTEQAYAGGDVNLGAGATAKDIVAGAYHTCALLSNDTVRCWGNNDNGELGIGNTTRIGDNEIPSSVSPVSLGGTPIQISAGSNHTCALLSTGNVRCWGYNGHGQLGYSDASSRASPGSDISLGGLALQVTTGGNHTCALLSTGTVKCWGYNGYGQLGYGNTTGLTSPGGIVNLGGATAFQVDTGANHTCALLSTGGARCWGYNSHGELGYGNTNHIGDNELPSTVTEVPMLPPAP